MNTCATCKWGRFEMTNHKPPRINKNRAGECEWPMERLVIPYSVSFGGTRRPWKSHVWADHGEVCPTWEAK